MVIDSQSIEELFIKFDIEFGKSLDELITTDNKANAIFDAIIELYYQTNSLNETLLLNLVQHTDLFKGIDYNEIIKIFEYYYGNASIDYNVQTVSFNGKIIPINTGPHNPYKAILMEFLYKFIKTHQEKYNVT